MDSNHRQPDRDLALLASNDTFGDGYLITGQVRTGAGTPLPGAAVTLIDREGRQISAGSTDQEGRYQLHPPRSGEYIVICAHPANHPHAARMALHQRLSTQDITLTGTGALTGRVVRETRHGADPVPGVLLALSDATGRVVASATSDASGGYTMSGLTEGSYTLTASPAGVEPTATAVHVLAGRSREWNLTLSNLTELSGVVRSSVTGNPLAEAMVGLVNGDGKIVATTRTDAEGRFRFTEVPADDSYTLTASGYPPIAVAAPLAPASPRHVTVQLGPR